MEKTLTTAAEVVELAFAEGEYMPESAVSAADIAVAECRYILPVVGRALYDKMLDGHYEELRGEYVAPAAALFTRLEMQPLLDIRTGRFGAVAPKSDCTEAAAREQILDVRRALRRKARTLLHRLSDYLGSHADAFPEYDPDDDILNRCTTDGGLVQTF